MYQLKPLSNCVHCHQPISQARYRTEVSGVTYHSKCYYDLHPEEKPKPVVEKPKAIHEECPACHNKEKAITETCKCGVGDPFGKEDCYECRVRILIPAKSGCCVGGVNYHIKCVKCAVCGTRLNHGNEDCIVVGYKFRCVAHKDDPEPPKVYYPPVAYERPEWCQICSCTTPCSHYRD